MTYRHSCVVDKENKYVEFVLILTDESGVDHIQYYTLKEGEFLVETQPPTMFVKPRWDSKTKAWWEAATGEEIEALLPTIEDARVSQKQLIASQRYEAEIAGLDIGNYVVATDRESQSLLAAAVLQTVFNDQYTVQWKMKDGFTTLDAKAIQVIATEVRKHVQACFDKEATLDYAIDQADTVAKVLKINWNN